MNFIRTEKVAGMRRYRIAIPVILLFLILSLPKNTGEWTYIDILRYVSTTFKGQVNLSDVAQDFYGFRAMLTNQDPYAILGPALKTIGVDWDLKHPSTHPPTAYLLVGPAAILRWPLSSAVWAWLMFACLLFGLRFGLEYSWEVSFLIAVLALLWPPIAVSFGQITLVWLFGLMIAYRIRNTYPFWSGIFIGVASLTKFLPAILLIPFILRRKWAAVAGFAVTWLTALGIILILSPNAIHRYITANRTNSINTINRLDNGAFTMFLYRNSGIKGLMIAAILVILFLALTTKIWLHNRDKHITQDEWNLYSFFAVLLLPIAWIYSLAPLVPQLLSLLQKNKVVRTVAIAAMLIPIIIYPWDESPTVGIFVFFILVGIAIALAQPGAVLPTRGTSSPDDPGDQQ
jgi:hypothetical protein